LYKLDTILISIMLFSQNFKVFNKYYLDVCFLYKSRKLKDGVIFFHCDANLDLYRGDHNPKFKVCCIIFNYYIFNFSIYNINNLNES
jgi:hypothetical protein